MNNYENQPKSSYYNVEVTINHANGSQSLEIIRFYSPYIAVEYAGKYLKCEDVYSVAVVNQLTGEIIFWDER